MSKFYLSFLVMAFTFSFAHSQNAVVSGTDLFNMSGAKMHAQYISEVANCELEWESTEDKSPYNRHIGMCCGNNSGCWKSLDNVSKAEVLIWFDGLLDGKMVAMRVKDTLTTKGYIQAAVRHYYLIDNNTKEEKYLGKSTLWHTAKDKRTYFSVIKGQLVMHDSNKSWKIIVE